MEIKAKEITLFPTSKLSEYPKNANKHTVEQIDKIIQLVEFYGHRDPLIVDSEVQPDGTHWVMAGNGRLLSAKKAGWDNLPVIFQKFQSEEEKYGFMVSHNAVSSSGWGGGLDLSQINVDITDLGPDFDVDLLGIKDFVIEPIEKFEPQADEDEVPEVVHPITRKGDIWLLGNHRLMCGDSTMIDELDKAIGGNLIDYLITDPPYGINAIKSSGVLSKRYEQYKGEENTDCAEDFMQLALSRFDKIMVFGGNYFAHWLPKSTHWLIWDKRGSEMGGGNKNGDQSDCEIAWTNLPKKNVKIYKHVWAGWFRSGNKKDELKTKVHPSQKPVGLFEKIFEDYNFDTMFDGFLGSGSTLIACEKTNRKCYGMELDEKYCDVIINRWQNYTGKKAVLESTKQTYEELKQERGE